MRRIDKIYRDKLSAEELAHIIVKSPCDNIESKDCAGRDCYNCVLSWLNEEVPDDDEDFIVELKAVKVLYPWAGYLTMDKNSSAYIFSARPFKNIDTWDCSNKLDRVCSIQAFDSYTNDWENSLINIDKMLEEAENNDD